MLRGHRESVDIDMFCDGPYGGIPFDHILEVLRFKFPYVEETSAFVGPSSQINNQGLYLFIGRDEETAIKTDILYWDAPYLYPPIVEDGIRLATVEDIAAMKLDTISRVGVRRIFGIYQRYWKHINFLNCWTFIRKNIPGLRLEMY